MDSSDLTTEQAARLVERTRRQLVYLNKLCDRIQRLGWPVNDPLAVAARKARDASQDLLTMARYAGMKSGVGKSENGGKAN